MATDDDDETADAGGMQALVRHYRLAAAARVFSLTAGEARFTTGRGETSMQPFQSHGQGFVSPPGVSSEEAVGTPEVIVGPPPTELLLQSAVIRLSERVPDGQLVEAVMIPWAKLVRALAQDPGFLQKLDWRKMEEIVAGAYRAAGYEVTLTPRSGDRGRDVIATGGSIKVCILDQVKRYGSGQRVSLDEVNAMLGVLTKFSNASKAFITTTASFAPSVRKDPDLQRLMPYRLELRDGAALLAWFSELAGKPGAEK